MYVTMSYVTNLNLGFVCITLYTVYIYVFVIGYTIWLFNIAMEPPH